MNRDARAALTDIPTKVTGRLHLLNRRRPAQPPGFDASRWSQYTVEEEIARGGMAVVYKVIDHRMSRRVAAKILADQFTGNVLEEQRFFNEARIMAELEHPNIVPVYDLGHDDARRPFYTMQLIQGDTLTRRLEHAGDVTPTLGSLDHFLEIFLKVCDAVAFAHSRGVLHRDIKPSNILIGPFGEVYLMDWGLARITRPGRFKNDDWVSPFAGVAELDVAGQAAGTISYMSPEQALGHNEFLDERTDVFLLGGTLYQILTGRTPYPQSDDLMAGVHLAREARIPPPRQGERWAYIPPGIRRIVMKALAREPAHRYQSVEELQHAVRSFLRDGYSLPTKTFAAGSIIMKEREPVDAAYLILRGSCQAYRTIEGEKIMLRRMGPGEVFGETAILSNKPRTATVEALEDLTVSVVMPELLAEELGIGTWVGAFVKTLAERFCEADERLATLESNLLEPADDT